DGPPGHRCRDRSATLAEAPVLHRLVEGGAADGNVARVCRSVLPLRGELPEVRRRCLCPTSTAGGPTRAPREPNGRGGAVPHSPGALGRFRARHRSALECSPPSPATSRRAGPLPDVRGVDDGSRLAGSGPRGALRLRTTVPGRCGGEIPRSARELWGQLDLRARVLPGTHHCGRRPLRGGTQDPRARASYGGAR